ncbi:universal stress protein [Desulfatitalea alkaliphila]|uniref:Universal stress protein n=1 Tax=Desulfatitalea alkaliphila TaxID=2929485 RepID=A0AA41QZY5_9BACT|nr:universal stress protein [Desulfatitalea alkaliphila]MCJ8499504.1 universal stress protein [Desulfatitalea alkaliphila]
MERRFLVAYNGSKPARAALELAIQNAATFNAALFVMTSMEGGHSEKPEDIARVQQALKEVRDRLSAAGVTHEVWETARGMSPGEDIVFFARENRIDHIFVGVEKKSRTRKLLLGSTAQYIILKATCPVTTTK